jgi:hypothetical protein
MMLGRNGDRLAAMVPRRSSGAIEQFRIMSVPRPDELQ